MKNQGILNWQRGLVRIGSLPGFDSRDQIISEMGTYWYKICQSAVDTAGIAVMSLISQSIKWSDQWRSKVYLDSQNFANL